MAITVQKKKLTLKGPETGTRESPTATPESGAEPGAMGGGTTGGRNGPSHVISVICAFLAILVFLVLLAVQWMEITSYRGMFPVMAPSAVIAAPVASVAE
jgi:hypothetical protein